ncbi:hypothetical protein [Aquimarina sediminis]|uniref:hypothetical protein n=1 Tax=Aquimarina sediminis TaxID=2070536 RepID=UPI000CA048AF|nr:hypothetical protein [Aquimarina sediminis]
MKNRTLPLLFLAILFNFSAVFGQYKITIQAYVLDQDTQKPIPYTNIGFIDKGIGTVTNKSGRFYLQYDEDKIKSDDIFQLSCIGYEPLRLTPKELFDTLQKNNTLFLKQSIFNLDEAIVQSEKRKIDSIGYSSYNSNLLAYWKDDKALGGEIAALIKVRKKNSKLLNLKFNIVENTADSLLVRVNIYDKKRKKPGSNILTSNIYHTISTRKGEEIIDLSPYNIKVDEDFIASIELIKVYGSDIQFAVIAGSGGRSFLRDISQDNWKELKEVGIAFKIDVSYPASSVKSEKRQKPEDITIYWDTSLSMQSRDLEKELTFLKKYLAKIKKANIDVITFSNKLEEKKHFVLEKGDSKKLTHMLSGLKYNGASDFSKLFKENKKADQYLVFTDGYATYGDHEFIYGTPVFYINSKKNANDTMLQEGGFSSEGHYLNLSSIEIPKALTYINHLVKDEAVYNNDSAKEFVSGIVFSDSLPIQGCKVAVKGTLVETVTDSDGKFSIAADIDQVLSFQHFSTYSEEIQVGTSKMMKVLLKPKYENLSEIALLQKKKAEKEKVSVGNKKVDRQKLGYASFTKNKEDFPSMAITLLDLIRGQFPGVSAYIDREGQSVVLVRGRSSIALNNGALFVVDDIIQNGIPDVTPPQIESITLIPGVSGAVRYGSQGRNGVFLIETKLGASITSSKDGKKKSLLVEGNDYKESIYLLDPNQKRPEYLNTLWSSSTYNEALTIYYELRKVHKHEVPFYVFCSDYFKRWDQEFSDEVVSNLAEISNDNYGVLRTLAFLLEEKGDIKKALVVYEKLFDLKSSYAQSYLDLGRVYKEDKQYDKAFEIYKRILENHKNIIGFTEVSKQTESELRHLLNHHRSHISHSDVPSEFLTVKSIPVRIVFDWNDPQAEFEFQFVNPNKKYEKWAHRFENNKELLLKETRHGVASKEFVVDDSMPGEWIVNVQSYGEVSKQNPTFMKYTIYRNYGLADETKTVKLIKLYNQNKKVTLDKFRI